MTKNRKRCYTNLKGSEVMEIIDGRLVASKLKEQIARKIDDDYLSRGRVAPTLACVLVGDDPASKVYVASKEKACKALGINSVLKILPASISQEEVAEVITSLNSDKNISGILLQLPLPKHLDEGKLISLISPCKDVDGLTYENLGKLFAGIPLIAPCTATGIIDLLNYYNLSIEGKHAVVIGRSMLVGKSVASLLEHSNATVTLCHSKTKNLTEITRQADILVVAIGKPQFITAEMVKEGAIVIDVGINRLKSGLVGDVDFESVKEKASYVTPVPGGVGPMTIAELMRNTLILHEHACEKTYSINHEKG